MWETVQQNKDVTNQPKTFSVFFCWHFLEFSDSINININLKKKLSDIDNMFLKSHNNQKELFASVTTNVYAMNYCQVNYNFSKICLYFL